MAHDRGESDWGEWLVGRIDDADPDGVAAWYLGCNGLVLKDGAGTTLWIDPYCGTGDPPRVVRAIPVPFDPADARRADAVLTTHEHADHAHGPTVGPILAATDATYHAPGDSLARAREEEWADDHAFDPGAFEAVSVGDRFSVGAFDVSVVTVSDPDATDPVGYVVDHDAGTVFHGGDTKPDPVLERVGESFDVDVAAVAFGSVGRLPDGEGGHERVRWYCDENDAVEVAGAVGADRLLPTHWDVWRGLTAEPSVLHHHARTFDRPRRVEVVAVGDRVSV